MWIREQIVGDSIVNRLIATFRIVEQLDTDAYVAGALDVVARHEILGARLIDVDGEPRLRLDAPAEMEHTVVDAPDWDEQRVSSYVSEFAARAYDLERGPLCRIAVLRVSDDDHVVVLAAHHLVVDLWSLAVLFTEINSHYGGLRGGQPETPRVSGRVSGRRWADHVADQSALDEHPRADACLAHWRRTFAAGGAATVPRLPTPQPGADPHRGEIVHRDVSSEENDALVSLARELGVPREAIVLAALHVVLLRTQQLDEIAVVTTWAGRTHRTARTIGCFAEPSLLLQRAQPRSSFRTVVRSVADEIAEAKAHRAIPFQQVVEVLRSEGLPMPSATIGFIWQKSTRLVDPDTIAGTSLSVPGIVATLGGLEINSVSHTHRPAALPLTLLLSDGSDRLYFGAEFGSEYFDAHEVRVLLDRVWRVIMTGRVDVDRDVAQLQLLGTHERAALAAEWAAIASAPTDTTSLAALLRDRCQRWPDRTAVRCGETHLTYAELEHHSEAMARAIALHTTDGSSAGVIIERSVGLVTALVACLKAGVPYVPIDQNLPVDRMAFMVQDAGATVLISDAAVPGPLADITRIDPRHLPDSTAELPAVGPDSLAYVMYTSGSTGTPKGVEIEQWAVAQRALALADLTGVGPDDVVVCQSAISFDTSVTDIFMALLVGAELVIADDSTRTDAAALSRLLDTVGATYMDGTPTAWRMLLEWGWEGRGDFIAVSGGEALTLDLAAALNARAGAVWNTYGPTESTVFATAQLIEPGASVVALGSPIPGTRVYVLDDHQQPVPDGTIGELYIAGNGVARGYHNRPDLTTERFLPDPFHPGDRMYRTGDLAHRHTNPDQPPTYHFHGRTDHQLKLRGQRIELGEIEATLDQHPNITASAVTTHQPTPDDTRLVAYITTTPHTTPPTPHDIRTWCQRTLPDHMIPTIVVPLDTFPLTTTNKIDRNQLPPPTTHHTPHHDTTHQPPHPGTETTIATIWATVLDTPTIGRHDNFFHLGGHSLLATRIASRLRRELGVEVPVSAVFRHPTVAELAAAIDEHAVVPVRPASADDQGTNHAGDFPLSYSQERMWFLHELEPDGLAYHITFAGRLRGPLELDHLQDAVATVVQRHAGLRSIFPVVDGAPVQRVLDDAPDVGLEIVDLGAGQSPLGWDAALATITADATEPFRLDQLPLIRLKLYRLADDDHGVLVSMHHIIGDEWAFGLLTSEVAASYNALRLGHGADLQDPGHAGEYARWHRALVDGRIVDEHIDYWVNRLRDARAPELPSDRPRPLVVTSQGETITAPFPEGLFDALQAFCRTHQVSPFMVMLAAFQLVVARLSGASDVTTGTAIANRNWLESENLVASLVNTLVLRTDTSGAPTFLELVRTVEAGSLEAFDHQDAPFAQVVTRLGTAGLRERPALYRTFFNVLNAPFGLPQLDGVDVEFVHVDRGATQLDLSLAISTAAQLAVVEYDTDLFDRARIEETLERFWRILEAGIETPEISTVVLPLCSGAETAALRQEWAAAAAEPNSDMPDPDSALRQRAIADPEQIAVRCGGDSVTYRTLDDWADRVATFLIDRGAGRETRVGIRLERSPEMIAAVVGVLRAGAAFVPLDPDLPVDRLRFITEDSECALMLVDRTATTRSDQDSGPGTTVTVDISDVLSQPVGSPVAPRGGPHDSAYIMYTSGSTGRPKGVLVERRQLLHFLVGAQARLELTHDDVVVALTRLSFDPSLMEILLPLAVGASITVPTRDETTDPRALIDLVRSNGATLVQATPTRWRMLLDGGLPPDSSLTAVCGGEVMTPELATQLAGVAGRVFNVYGPTETTVWSTFERLPDGFSAALASVVALGSPIPGTRVYVLDDHQQPVPDGTIGELYIAGNGVARGYHNRPDLTTERFLPDPFHPGDRMYRTGDLAHRHTNPDQPPTYHFHGRTDHQLKLRGQRIELGEIEATLDQHPNITASAVTTHQPTPDDTRLVAYITTTPHTTPPTPHDIRTWCQRTLPDHMIPTIVVPLDTFPLTTTNKIDRNQLPPPTTHHTPHHDTTHQPPHPGTETTIATIWATVLDTPTIGRHDNFFHLGGHSLLAIRLISEVERRLGVEVPLSSIFQTPTLMEFATAVESGTASKWTSLVPIQPAGDERPFFYVAPYLITSLSFANLGQVLGRRPLYVLQPQGIDTGDSAHATVEAMAEHYLAEIRDVQPAGPYLIGGHCAGGTVAAEMVFQLERRGEAADLLVLVDAEAPGAPLSARGRVHPVRRAWQYFRDGRLRQAISWQLHLVYERVVQTRVGSPTEVRIAQVRRQHATAHAVYQPPSLCTDVALILSEEWNAPDRRSAVETGWFGITTGRITTRAVCGTHAGLVEMANSSALGAAIESELAACVAP